MKKLSECRILLVDDSRTNLHLLVQALKNEYRLSVAVDGRSALISVASEPPDLILLDIMMPEMDGYEVCQRLKAHPDTWNIPIIFLSAMDQVANKTAGFELGAVDYVTKPFDILEVKARVKTHLSLKLAEIELKESREEFRRLSLTDDLTGFYNTRYLYQALEKLIAACDRHGRPTALIFMDLDNFKDLVDTHGHLYGSQALAEVAGTIKATLGLEAFGVAYGGDEFVIVLPGLNKDQALDQAETIRARMNQTEYLTGRGLAVRISASFGVAACPDDAMDMKRLLALADQALFEAKETKKGGILGAAPGPYR